METSGEAIQDARMTSPSPSPDVRCPRCLRAPTLRWPEPAAGIAVYWECEPCEVLLVGPGAVAPTNEAL